MTSLYFLILLVSFIIPFLYSIFYLDFIKKWKNFLLSTTIVAVIFLIWDAIFTKNGVWGFEEKYYLGFKILKMPIEEWLFFYIIPFCSLFTHYAFFYKFQEIKLKKSSTVLLTVVLIFISLSLLFVYNNRAYTFINYIFLSVVLIVGVLYKIELLQKFYITFLIILVPFIIVNGILTGAITEQPVVWYDNTENLGIRLGTIPVEDIGYAFSMLFGNMLIFEKLNTKYSYGN